MATAASAAAKRSAQPSGAGAASQQRNSRMPTAQSRQPSQAKPSASRAQNGGTRAGTRNGAPAASKPASKAPSGAGSKAPSKAATRQGTRASQKKPAGEPMLATVGEDGQIIVGDGDEQEAEGEEGEYYDEDDEYYDEDGEYYDEEGEGGEPGEEGGEEYVDEEEEEEFDYATFQYRPYKQYARDPDEPRVTIETGPEGCSCFPTRSSRNIPSMLYDRVDCKHQNLQGYAQLGVYRFDDNWDNRHEATLKPKLADRLMPNKGYVWGYPNFAFVETNKPEKPRPEAEDEEYYEDEDGQEEGEYYDEEGEEYEGDEQQYDEEGEYDKEDAEYDEEGEDYEEDEEEEQPEDEEEEEEREGYYDEYGDYHLFEDEESLPSRMYDSEGRLLSREQSVKPPSTAPKPSSALEAILPRIGFTPEPSEHASRLGTAARTPLSLPPITPVSAQGSMAGSQYSYAPSREKTPARFKPRTLHRTFQGKYYDPVTKQSYEFEITPDFRRRMDRWNVKKEGLEDFNRGGGTAQSLRHSVGGGGSRAGSQYGGSQYGGGSRAGSQYGGSQTARGYDRQVVTRW